VVASRALCGYADRPMTQEALTPLDPSSPPQAAGSAPRVEGGFDRGRAIALGAMGALVATGIGLIVSAPRREVAPPGHDRAAAAVAVTSALSASVAAPAAKEAEPAPVEQAKPRPPPAWRAANLKGDASIEVIEGTFGKRSFSAAMASANIPKDQVKRLVAAFDGVKHIERPREKDAFVIAKDRAKGTLTAFEYIVSPTEIYQARTNENGAIDAKRLELYVEQKRIGTALVISADLEKAIEKAGLRKELIEMVDDAVEGHVDPGTIRPGVRMRVAASEEWVEGQFTGVRLDGLELVPKSGAPIRVYFYERGADVEGSKRRAPLPGFYDAKGKQPYRGAFRSPIPLARVTSRFNPKRMHPVLKQIMPHQGVDFAGSTGTPVFASAPGTVVTAGNGGPCGNMVEIDHAGGISTVYCHLSRFEKGLHAGMKVEARQPIGAVGQTGRVTGPHLHFGVKKNGVFIDPLSMKMDGVRVLPPADRDAFAKRRAEVDQLIDGIALPSVLDVPDQADDQDKDLHAE
jgi:murein DD-endopeptidase MepM/ murein hydrolase activator NlpD